MSLLMLLEEEENEVIPTYTWATRPASAQSGVKIRITDIGPAGSEWVSDGSSWLPVNGYVLLARSGTGVSVTGTTNETALATITIPASAMGTNGQLRVTALYSNNHSGNNKTHRIRFGGAAGTVYTSQANTTNLSYQIQVMVRNRNVANSQVGFAAVGATFGVASGANATSSVNTAAETTVVISSQLAHGPDSATLESYTVELLR